MPSASSPVSNDAFPATQYTLIGRMLGDHDRGALEAARHVMTAYAGPLKVYYIGSSFRSLGEADDVVQGFFASRLARDNFLTDWMTSRRQLRYWLMTAFKHYLFEQVRGVKTDRERSAPLVEINIPCDEDDEQQFHREAALTMVREAMRIAEEACRESGQEDHWRVFVRHHVDGRSYEQLQEELGIDRKKFNVMARTAGNKLRAALRELLSWRGASEEDIDTEIQALMEVIK
jgi:DNA-directed RNA polymerase specialized sigma24 family protein